MVQTITNYDDECLINLEFRMMFCKDALQCVFTFLMCNVKQKTSLN